MPGDAEEDQRRRLMSTAVAVLSSARPPWRCQPPAPRIAGPCRWSATPSYKQAGCYFRSTQAIQYFGNAGCHIPDDVRIGFALHIRRRIGDIMRLEWVLPALSSGTDIVIKCQLSSAGT